MQKTFYTFFIVCMALLVSCSQKDIPNIGYTVKHSTYNLTVRAQGTLEAKSSQVIGTPMVWPAPTLSYLIEEGSKVSKGDVVARFTATEVENDYTSAMDEVEIAKAEAQRIEAELELEYLEYQTQLNSALASAKSAQLQLARIEFEAPRVRQIKMLEIEQFELEAERARQNMESLKKIQQEERANYQLRIQQAEGKLIRAKEQLDRLVLRAPFDGLVVHGINPITDEKVQEGITLYPRMPVVQIPDLSVMHLKAQINETDAQKLTKGQRAIVWIPSLGNREYEAAVSKVDKVAKPISRGSKVKKVEILVELDSTNTNLAPGLTGETKIFVNELTDMIAVPHETVFERDSVKFVYVHNGDQFYPEPVASLTQDEDFMIVYGALQDGQTIALREPGSNVVDWPDTLITPVIPAALDTLQKRVKPDTTESNPEGAPDRMNRQRGGWPGGPPGGGRRSN